MRVLAASLIIKGAAADSKRVSPVAPKQIVVDSVGAAQNAAAAAVGSRPQGAYQVKFASKGAGTDCAEFPGTYTGVSHGSPIYDSYTAMARSRFSSE